MKKTKVFRIIVMVSFVLILTVISVHAQPGDPPGGGGGGGPVGGAGVPIDGGFLSILLTGGLLFSLFGKKNKKDEEEVL